MLVKKRIAIKYYNIIKCVKIYYNVFFIYFMHLFLYNKNKVYKRV